MRASFNRSGGITYPIYSNVLVRNSLLVKPTWRSSCTTVPTGRKTCSIRSSAVREKLLISQIFIKRNSHMNSDKMTSMVCNKAPWAFRSPNCMLVTWYSLWVRRIEFFRNLDFPSLPAIATVACKVENIKGSPRIYIHSSILSFGQESCSVVAFRFPQLTQLLSGPSFLCTCTIWAASSYSKSSATFISSIL